MPNPKRRHSKTRSRKRRTHDVLDIPVLAKCPVTGVFHRYHCAHWHEDKLYYKGQVILDKTSPVTTSAESNDAE